MPAVVPVSLRTATIASISMSALSASVVAALEANGAWWTNDGRITLGLPSRETQRIASVARALSTTWVRNPPGSWCPGRVVPRTAPLTEAERARLAGVVAEYRARAVGRGGRITAPPWERGCACCCPCGRCPRHPDCSLEAA